MKNQSTPAPRSISRTKNLLLLLALFGSAAMAQQTWVADSRSSAGPVARVELPLESGKSRLAMIAFEYARKCDPLFTYVEMRGRKFGTPEKQSKLPPSSIGGSINGKRYSGSSAAAATIYSNGIEVGFGMPDDMAMSLAFDAINSISFTTPAGKEIPLPIAGLKKAVETALDICTQKVSF